MSLHRNVPPLLLAGCLFTYVSALGSETRPFGEPFRPHHVELLLDLKGFTGPVADIAFSPDGTMLAACGGREVRIWDVRTGQPLRTLRGQIDHDDYGDCLAVAFSHDNCELVVGIRSHSEDGSLRVYDIQDIAEMKELVGGLQVPVTKLAFSHNGRFLAAACGDGKLVIYDWPLRRIVGSREPAAADTPSYSTIRFPLPEMFLLTHGPAGAAVLSVPGCRDLALDERLPLPLLQWAERQADVESPFGGTIGMFDLQLQSDTWLAGGVGKDGDRSKYWVGCWTTTAATPSVVYDKHHYPITAIALNRACTLAASADSVGEVHVWETNTGRERYRFRSLGQPVYRAAYDAATQRIGFTTKPTSARQWGRNNFGVIDRVFDIGQRAIVQTVEGDFSTETTRRGGELSVTYRDGRFGLRFAPVNGGGFDHEIRSGFMPTCFTLLRSRRLGIDFPTIVGDDGGMVYCYDPTRSTKRREFLGHQSFVTSLSESADGRFLTTSSTDRTIRIWSLKSHEPLAWLGVRLSLGTVTEVPRGSPAETAGIRVGDRFLSMDGIDAAKLTAPGTQGRRQFQPGQRVTLKMERNAQPYETELVLRETPDQVEPLLSLFFANDDDWIAWTPQGYYDASPGCGDLLGWHVNRGKDRSAAYYPVHQFRRQLYRPDIVYRALESGSIEEAIRQADVQTPGQEPQSPSPAPLTADLRDPPTMQRMQPPRVRLLSPQDGLVTREGQVHVLAEVVSQNDLPVTDVRVLVNGRPGFEKGVSVVSDDSTDRRRISFSRAVTLLPGENEIAVLASNGTAVSVPVTVRVKYDAPTRVVNAKPDLHLLSIGISEYEKQHLNLRFAHLDAQAFADAWEGQHGPVYEEVSKTLLINEEASGPQIQQAMKQLVSGVERRDIAVIFISAHGLRDRQLEYYLATHEIDPDDLSGTGIHFSAISAVLEVLPCKVLLFVDTCHAAGITGAKSVWRDPLYELTSDEYGAIVFSSSLSREISVEDPKWGHGAFTKAILDTFDNSQSDINGDGFLSLTELEQSVCDRVQEMTNGQQHPVMKRPSTIHNIPFYRLGSS